MKIIIAVICVTLSITLQIRAEVISPSYIKECLEKFPFRPSEYDSCVYKKAGIQEQDGSINFPKLKEALIERYQQMGITLDANTLKVLDKAIERCKNVRGSSDSDTVEKVQNCIDESFKS